MPFAIYQFVDRRVATLILSDGFCELFGYTDRAKAYHDMDNDMYVDTHPDDASRIAEEALRFATEGGSYDVIYRSRIPGTKDYRMIHAMGEHFRASTGERLAAVWYTDEGRYNTGDTSGGTLLNRDLNEALHEQSLLKASNYDYLTGLPSMTYFFELAESARQVLLDAGDEPMMMFMDLSGMKFYNGRYGYSKGDELLISFARLLAKYFGNERCCRVGEDHFAAVTGKSGIEEKLDSLFSEWKEMYKSDALAIRVGIYRESVESVDVSSACDRAKYACDSMRNVYESSVSWFDEKMLYEARGKQYIIENLDRAIEEKWLTVYYQAIVRSTSGKVCDEEALARWIDPERGMMSPGFFVPVLEEAGLIYKLDLFVVEQVLEKIRKMKEYGLPIAVPISVNLSRKDFESCDIIDEICKRVDASGFGRDAISIEITESTVARDIDFMKAQVERFRELGFKVWMDDFGSGYSSLDVLQTIKFDLIKFDMHFMQQFDSGNESRIILTELMKMAGSLGVETICEGVEREDQVHFLREIGCSKIQGYYYEKPLSLEALLEKFDRGLEIGFENPEEKAYYEAIGRINLYDLSMIAGRDDSSLKNYFDTLPMAIIEVNGEEARFLRSNQAYRGFVENTFGYDLPRNVTEFSKTPQGIGPWFLERVRECSETGNSVIVDERMKDGTILHSFIRSIDTNPLTGSTAVAVAVLAVTEDGEGVTYANIARAMAADYYNLFYVDLDTEEFIEYRSPAGEETIAVERHDSDFFNKARKDAADHMHAEDLVSFLRSFTKENIIRTLDEQKSYTLNYRLLVNDRPVFMNMKATRMQDDDSKIIIGVSNINLQMNQRRAIEKLMQEQAMYNRLKALLGDIMVMYTIDPETDAFIESSADSRFEGLGVAKAGDNFFQAKDMNADKLIHPDDRMRFKLLLEKEILLKRLEKKGVFTMKYRMLIDGESVTVRLRAAMVKESGENKLIIAVNHLHEDE